MYIYEVLNLESAFIICRIKLHRDNGVTFIVQQLHVKDDLVSRPTNPSIAILVARSSVDFCMNVDACFEAIYERQKSVAWGEVSTLPIMIKGLYVVRLCLACNGLTGQDWVPIYDLDTLSY